MQVPLFALCSGSVSESPRAVAPPSDDDRSRRRLRSWWFDTLGLTGALILASLALYEAVSSVPGFSSTIRAWLDAIGVALIVGPLFAFTLYRRQIDSKLRRDGVGRRTRVAGSPHHKVRLTILSALAIISLITILDTAVEQHAITGMFNIGDALNLAGRQRSHGQRVQRLVWTARVSPVDSLDFDAAERRLVKESDSLDVLVSKMLSFEDTEARAAEAARREAAAARRSLLESIADFHMGAGTASHVAQRADALVLAQEQFVSRLASLASMNIRRIQRAVWTFGALLITILLGFGGLVVEPIVRLLRNQHAAVTTRSEALARTTALLEEAQTVARMGTWTRDLSSDTVDWSKSTYSLFGRPLSAGPPRLADAVERYAPESVPPMLAALEHTRVSGEPFSLLLRTSEHNPAVRWIRADGRARLDDSSKVTGLYGILVDVTESVEREAALRDAQARAEAANRSKSEFLANMSHEIRTPLTAIIGYADWLREEASQAVSLDQQHALQTIHRASTHLLAVINDILDLSKIEAGQMHTEEVETILPAVLLDVESIARARAAGKGVSLETRLLSPIPERVLTDPTRLRQILMNLVGNAVKFTERGRVRVDVRVDATVGREALRLTIEDTGVGMTPEQVRDLFQPFQQGDASVTRRFGGTGLGLSISRRLATLLGGDVSIVSSTPGVGSCFAIEIPLRKVPDTPMIERLESTAPGLVEAPRPNALAGVRLLLAEDGEDNQRLLRVLLEAAGAKVTVVSNGKQALETLEWSAEAGANFDLLLTDMQMPEMDGYTLATTLRTRGATLPIIALTAHAMAEDRVRCLDAGCSDYAIKPVNRPALIALLARWTRAEGVHTAALLNAQVNAANDAQGDLPAHLPSDLADDPDLGPLADAFAQVLPDRIEAISSEYRQADRRAGRRLVHQLKGAAGSYGYPLISRMASELESVWEGDERAEVVLEQLRVAAGRAFASIPSRSAS